MRTYRSGSILRYSSPTPKIICFGAALLLLAGVMKCLELILSTIFELLYLDAMIDLSVTIFILLMMSGVLFLSAIIEAGFRSNERDLKYVVRRMLCAKCYGNPLHLRDGEIEPDVAVISTDKGYRIRVECVSADFDDVSELETAISGCLRRKYKDFGVVSKEEDIAGCYVDYYVENVVSDFNKQSVYHSVEDIPAAITKVYIREDVFIDYARVLNSSVLVAGRSRSGKTTAIIIVFLIPMLKQGRDEYGSLIIIIDPKSAELSLCPHVLSPDENGSVEHILEAVRRFNLLRIERQRIINDVCRESGVSKKWFEIGMHPSVLFIDEFVSFQDMLPQKPSKENPDYCLSAFQGLLRQIATQGASAGCFLILSTAEASVGNGGISSTVNNACGIRILFKPSREEARFLWDSEKLKVLRERRYVAGDAWFSADDGINNSVRFVKFPRPEFGEYAALSRLLSAYYENSDEHSAKCEANERCAVPESDDAESP